jgi:hypothetical protein
MNLAIVSLLWMATSPVFLFLWMGARRLLKASLAETEAIKTTLAPIKAELAEFREKYGKLASREAELQRVTTEHARIEANIESLRATLAEKQTQIRDAEKTLSDLGEEVRCVGMGVRQPNLEHIEDATFRARIETVRARQKEMVNQKLATMCPKGWTIQGSKTKGDVMLTYQRRLTLRAFHNECDLAIAAVGPENFEMMERRILASETAINKENTLMDITLNDAYVDLKLDELRLYRDYRAQHEATRQDCA